jgi:hypothetical protein
MKRFLVLVTLGCSLALALEGCDYGYDEGEDPAGLEEPWGSAEYGLQGDDEGTDSDWYDPPALAPAGPGVATSVGYVRGTAGVPGASLPVSHPDPKPWKK